MTTGTLTLTDFLLARIEEDEADANLVRSSIVYIEGEVAAEDAATRLSDPARVLAQCKAHRAIVEEYVKEQWVVEQGHRTEWTEGGQAARLTTLHALASIYADHPSFRQEWA
jgi:hypothetical protein